MKNLFLYGQNDIHDDVHCYDYRSSDFSNFPGILCSMAQEENTAQ